MTSKMRPPVALRASVIAVQGALALFGAVLSAQAAEDPTVAELVTPQSTVEVGATFVNRSSYKFAEYNGLQNKGLNPLVNFELRGGGAWDSGSIERWRLYGRDLGLDTRSLGGEYARQGSFRLGLDFDQLRRNYADDYQTIYNGAGTSTLVLVPGYPAAAARTATSGLANWNNLQSPNLNATTTGGGPGFVIPALMQNFNVATRRERTALAGEINLTPQWTVAVTARNERKDGVKLTGAAMGGFKGTLLPEPINSDTNIVEAVARYTDRQAHFSVGYNASFYRNSVDGFTAESPFATGTASGAVLNNRVMMNGAPDNQMHQFVVDGGYRFTAATKLVLSASHTRMTQNEPFHYQSGTGWNVNGGATSSDSKETQTNFLARLTSRPMDGLDLTGQLKYDNRDNRSAVGNYTVTQADGIAVPAASSIFNNVPLNRKTTQVLGEAKYSFSRSQSLSGALEHVIVERTADASINPISHEINNPFASGKATENTLRLAYRQGIGEGANAYLSYSRSQRKAHDYEEPEVATPASGVNVGGFGEVPGFRQFFLASRNRDKLRGSLDFQATEQLFVQASVDYMQDKYPSQFGLKKAGSQVFNLDGTYAASDALTFNAFATAEHMKQRAEHFQIPAARGATVPTPIPHVPDGTCASYTSTAGLPVDYLTDPCRNWSESQSDRVFTFGMGVKSSQFMGGKLTLAGDLVYSRARTKLAFTGGTYYNNGIGSNVYVPAADMPDITSSMADLRLSAKYAIDKNQSVKAALLHRQLRSSDSQYDLFGFTSVQAYLGSGMTSPRYHVNAVSISYGYAFR